MTHTSRLIVFVLLTGMLFSPGKAAAQQSALQFYEVRLPDNFPAYNIRFAEQDEARLLWFVSGNGLYRFDGSHLLRFDLKSDPALPSFPVTSMKAGLDGNLWLGFRNGAARFDLKKWCIEPIFAADWDNPHPRDRNIRTIYRSPDGEVYFGTESGKLYVFQDGGLELILDMTGTFRRSGRYAGIMTIQEPYPGQLWLTTGNGMLVHLPASENGYGQPAYYKPAVALNKGIGNICFGPRGECIFSVASGGVYRVDTRKLLALRGTAGLGMDAPAQKGYASRVPLPEGAVSSAHAPFYIPGGKAGMITDPAEGSKNIYTYDFSKQEWHLETPVRPVNFPGSKIYGISTNPAATYVCSAAGITSLRFREQALTPLLSGFDNPNSIRSVYRSPDGDLYIGSYRDRFIRFSQATGEVVPLSRMFIYSILPWNADTLLLATEGDGLQWYLPRENRFRQVYINKARLTEEGRALDANVTALHRVNDTLVWAGTYQGVYLLNPVRGDVYTVLKDSQSVLLQSSKVRAILPAPGIKAGELEKGKDLGKYLFATTRGVFESNLDDGTVRYFLRGNAAANVRTTEVFCMQRIGDMIWMGTGGRGLMAADASGRLAGMDWLNGELAGSMIFSMVRSGDFLLAGTDKGLSVIHLPDSSIVNYTTLNGLPAGEFNHSAVFGDSLQAYLGTINGLVRWQPARPAGQETESPLREKGSPLRVYITRLLTSDRDNRKQVLYRFPYLPEGPAGISIPAGINYFSINFSSLDHDIGLLSLYYRIEPEGSWNGIDRRGEITFVKTRPGDYQLELAGRTPDGSWVKGLLNIPLQVKPAFHQTFVFKLLMVLIPVLLVALFFRYREIQLQKERQLRIKIADDLHDEVGSSLSRIWHQASQAMPERQLDGGVAGKGLRVKPLDAISETSRAAIGTMNDIVWSIDSRFDTLQDLVMRMKDYIYKLEDELDIPVKFTVEGQLENKKVSQIIRQNLFLLFKEAVSNAMKHGGGGEIIVRMDIHEQMELQVINAFGDNPARDSCAVQGGRGLENMRRRTLKMRGDLRAGREGDKFMVSVRV